MESLYDQIMVKLPILAHPDDMNHRPLNTVLILRVPDQSETEA